MSVDHAKPPVGVTERMPSPSSRATASALGPRTANRNGTRIGRAGACPGPCSSRVAAPSTSTISPASSARSWRAYWATNAHEFGRCPIASRPVKPEPMPTLTRPGARSTRVAIAAAVTMT